MNEHLSRVEFLDGPRDKGQSSADIWKWDERMEELACLRDSDPDAFDRMGVTARLSLGYYENDKKIAAQHGRDVNKGGK
ncbi:hypothetical protein OIE62_15920 [Streptomyces scopuliridis]|uniref:Uncharacterized protein n=1 Tax=Streptomyces scopuliridis TaxID=452529 RepID=A0ACD4ZNB7_9ACTN|nr:hypothetical protein [Streptomyces scopuliridis]WSB99935.1 hypothetical protein OG835_25035 [Streptomyces scopuliridis]WSC06366.1 hypothetical protein OIE62_15920 [Streptomyces scopuliridis]